LILWHPSTPDIYGGKKLFFVAVNIAMLIQRLAKSYDVESHKGKSTRGADAPVNNFLPAGHLPPKPSKVQSQ